MENNIWITVTETANCLGLTNSAIKESIRRNVESFTYRYISGRGRGGKQIQILLDSLPQEAQERYYNKPKEYAPILH